MGKVSGLANTWKGCLLGVPSASESKNEPSVGLSPPTHQVGLHLDGKGRGLKPAEIWYTLHAGITTSGSAAGVVDAVDAPDPRPSYLGWDPLPQMLRVLVVNST